MKQSYLDESTLIGEAAHIAEKTDGRGNVTGRNHKNDMIRRSRMPGKNNEQKKAQQDSDMMLAWARQQAANDQQQYNVSVINVAQVAAALMALRSTANNEKQLAQIGNNIVDLFPTYGTEITKQLEEIYPNVA